MKPDAFFDPRGVAVVGASRDPHKLGYGVVRNLVEHHYRGAIYPVNPVAGEILGRPCYSSVAEVPDPVDLAVIVVPARAVTGVVEECGERGIRHLIVTSGGFRETGPEGEERERDLIRAARRYDMRVIGPNCIGTIDTHSPVNTTFVVGMPRAGDIGFVSQSGALCAAVIDWARGAGVGFSRIVSLGNQVDVTETEMLSALADDPRTRVITAYIEGVADGRVFLESMAEAARRKPVIVIKAGHGEVGARAVASHTGALAGTAEAYQAAFDRSGVLTAHTTEDLFDRARALAWQPLPEGNRVAVLTNAGGPGILAVDALESAGLRLAPLTGETKSYLRQRLPAAGSVENPVDILAGSGAGTYAVALDAILSDPTADAALVVQAPQDWFLPASLAEVIGEVAAAHNKPVLASVMGLASVDQALAILHERRVPNFSFPERAAGALAAMVARRRWLETPIEEPHEPAGIDRDVARPALAAGDFPAALAAYGIPVAETRRAARAGDAARAAEEIGYPVVLKLLSPSISHKSDVDGVALGLGDGAAVESAFERILDRARSAFPEAKIEGVLVQKMVTGGREVLVGMRRDSQFGPVVVVGTGGTEVELLRDVSLGIAPLSPCEAERMLDATRAGTRLRGWRGYPPGDRSAVLDVMMRLSWLACDFPEIAEIEINPLFVFQEGGGTLAVDVRGGREGRGAGGNAATGPAAFAEKEEDLRTQSGRTT
jgi:acetyl coenzyme A synthetase (ADP forming)-like protein